MTKYPRTGVVGQIFFSLRVGQCKVQMADPKVQLAGREGGVVSFAPAVTSGQKKDSLSLNCIFLKKKYFSSLIIHIYFNFSSLLLVFYNVFSS